MEPKQLKPTLPKEAKEILEKGFRGNISGAEKFITDGNVLILKSNVLEGMLVGTGLCAGEKPVALEPMAKLWDEVVSRKGMPGEFIGCAAIARQWPGDEEKVVIAVIRGQRGGCLGLNPWKLKFVVTRTGADRLLVDAGFNWKAEPVVALRGETPVAIIMPMRYTERDVQEYDLEGEAVGL